jgi:hypothetical protein
MKVEQFLSIKPRRGRRRLGLMLKVPSGPGEFHPEPLTQPDVNLSIHPARAIVGRLPPSAEIAGSSGFEYWNWPPAYLEAALPLHVLTTDYLQTDHCFEV